MTIAPEILTPTLEAREAVENDWTWIARISSSMASWISCPKSNYRSFPPAARTLMLIWHLSVETIK